MKIIAETVLIASLIGFTLGDGFAQETRVVKPTGRYFAMLIAVSNYSIPRLNLDGPVKDAANLKAVLESKYDFEKENIINVNNPNRQEIISALFNLRKKITANDNLLIFYAGHGFWDKDAKQGYWWPRDTDPDDPSNWLSNSDIREQIRGINSAHTLLISDACFSGGIFKSRSAEAIKYASLDIIELYKLPSRRAITSGTMTTVPDNSIFLQYLIKRLDQNTETFLSSQKLFDSFRTAVINNGGTIPQDGVIDQTGDEGGDFIFIKKGMSATMPTAVITKEKTETVTEATNPISKNPVHFIGEKFGGGIVFYVYDGGQHGLIAAPVDQSTGIKWGKMIAIDPANEEPGAGKLNTERIVGGIGEGDYAALVCVRYDGGNYFDWYLPSKFELNLLYQQKKVVGGFADNFYWSSTPEDKIKAWDQAFTNGQQSKFFKNTAYPVRAIRGF